MARRLARTSWPGISAAIAAIPEEPPILLAVILGLGAYRLLRRDVLVRRLNAEETLGAIDLIITDKTGTLTRNRLDVVSVRDLGRIPSTGVSARCPARRAARRGRCLGPRRGHAAGLVHGVARPGDRGIGRRREPRSRRPRLVRARHRRPARSRSRGVAVRSASDDLAIGAPEAVLALTRAGARTRHAPGTSLIEAGAGAGERLVGRLARGDDGRPWHLRALIGFADPLRDGIREALDDRARGRASRSIVVTGDHPLDRRRRSPRAAGLDAADVVVGEEIARWDDARLTAELPRLRIVARSTPDQKERLVRLARDAGRTVVVTGDGVNDAPALHRADVAVAMGSGTGVAKEAADLVLGDDSFATLMYGLAEGRRIVDNVQKGLVFLISTHVALLGFILIATLYGFGQPLLPLQILWLELFIDLSTSVAFELEKAEPDLMRRPPRRRDVPLLTERAARPDLGRGRVQRRRRARRHGHPSGLAPSTRAGSPTPSSSCAQAVRANANRSLRIPIHRLPLNWFLLAAGLIVIGVQAAIPQVPLLAEAFRATPLDASDWAIVAVIALAPAVLAEVVRTVTGRTWVA